MPIMSSILHDSLVSETGFATHASRASLLARASRNQRLASSFLIEFFQTHHTGIQFGNGVELQP